jgi:primosomal protein N' (replication factor Y)
VKDGLRVLRMDADTTSSRDAYERILGKFRRHEADVLLGTQMVTKGHDFPDVALSGVLLADTSLYTHDFRAAERTFALLTQVIGRAGRGNEAGRAIVQTLSPSHHVIRLAAKQDYPAFYEEEIALRRALAYPPFCDIVMVGLSTADEGRLFEAAKWAREKLLSLLSEAEGKPAFALYGPLEAPAYRVAGKYRLRISVKCRLRPALRRMFGTFSELLGKQYPDIVTTVDFNPTDS